MSPVFLDTVGLLAIWDTSDQWHEAASSAYRLMLEQGRSLTTTPQVLNECGNAASRRAYREDVCALRELLLDERLLVEPSGEEIDDAWVEFREGEPGDAGIVDLISFAVMRRLGLTDAFTNDRHFKVAGFTTLF